VTALTFEVSELHSSPMANDLTSILTSEDPFENFLEWSTAAEQAKLPEATAMTLATASREGVPSARIVLYKGLTQGSSGQKGFRLFTNYDSHKAQDLLSNPRAALVFFWAQMPLAGLPPVNRQIRVEGTIEKLSDTEADEYFQSRPHGSRIGAWASPQSQKIASREELLARVASAEQRFKDPSHFVPRPPNWGGFLLVPSRFEFWQAGEFRLHDRFIFERDQALKNQWQISRLAP